MTIDRGDQSGYEGFHVAVDEGGGDDSKAAFALVLVAVIVAVTWNKAANVQAAANVNVAANANANWNYNVTVDARIDDDFHASINDGSSHIVR